MPEGMKPHRGATAERRRGSRGRAAPTEAGEPAGSPGYFRASPFLPATAGPRRPPFHHRRGSAGVLPGSPGIPSGTASMEEKPQPSVCPTCEAEVEPRAVKCRHCGASLGDGPSVEQVTTEYTPSSIQVLEGLEAVRKRPA